METARQIIICCDGTNNTVTGRQRDTNVLRLLEHVRQGADANQVLYYDPGVGSPDTLPPAGPTDWLSRKWERLSGLAVGRGAFENIGEAYAFLMRQWRPGTQVWIFGFSRGAFTARSISGMVHLFGILAPEHESLLPTLLRVYFAQPDPALPRARERLSETFLGLQVEPGATRTRDVVAGQLQGTFTTPEGRNAGVHFVGVWDTVEAIGMPGFQLRMSSKPTIGNKRIYHARHALALDEHRLSFTPRLYSEADFGGPDEPRSLRQRWFRGVHGDSGGGYAPEESGLSERALHWMVEEARACGLRCPPLPVSAAEPKVHDPLYTVPWWAVTGLALRKVTGPPPPHEHPSVDEVEPRLTSVWQRRRAWQPVALALLGALLFLTAQGWFLIGALTHPLAAWTAAVQFGALPLQVLASWGDWRSLWEAAPRAMPVSALLADFGLLASYAYLLGHGLSWAFTRRAGYRREGDPLPAWHRLGRALPLLVIGDAAENLLLLLALALVGWPVPVLLVLAGLAGIAKLCGAAGCAALLLLGLLPAKVRRPQPPALFQQP